MSKWRSVFKELPQAGQDCVVWCGWCITATYKHPRARKPAHDWHTEDGVNPVCMVTHWMPAPKEPRQAKSAWMKLARGKKK